MEKINNKKILQIVSLCIIIIVPFLKFFSMNLEVFGILNSYDNINPAIVLFISIPFLLFIYIKDIIDKKRKLDVFDYLFYALLFTSLLSIIFSIDKSTAIFGKDFRHEGFLSILSYYLLIINWKVNGNKRDIKKFIKLLIIIGILNSIYALFQIYTPFKFIIRYTLDRQMASGLCGNPNFFGSLIVTVISIATCKFLMEKVSIKKVLLIILLFISLINSQSTGPFLTFIIVIIFLIFFLNKKKKIIKKNIIVLIIILLLTYISVYFININVYKSNRCEMCDIEETINNGGNGRLEIWENSLDIIKKYPIVGVGFDNFYLVYPNPKIENSVTLIITECKIEKEEPKSVLIYDNAHNVYLHNFVSTGILGLIPYLILCLLTFINGLKLNSDLGIIILSGFVAYSIQAFANISVIQVAPIYYIIIGLILSIKKN